MIQPFNRTSERHLYGGRDVMKHIYAVLDFFYFLFSWFTVIILVFLRRDFGERYLTKLNFLMGYIILCFWTFFVGGIFSLGRRAGSSASTAIETLFGSFSGMVLLLFAYLLLGSIHFVNIWWRNRTDRPLHSLDPGKSWLLPLGRMLIKLVNIAAFIPIKLFALTLSSDDKKQLDKLLPIVPDSRAFTERFLEPVFLLFLGFILMMAGGGAVGFLLVLLSGFLAVNTNYRYETERHQFLHLRDQILEAKYLPDAINGTSDVIRLSKGVRESVMQTAAQMEQDAPEMMEEFQQTHPSLADAMAAMINKNKPKNETMPD